VIVHGNVWNDADLEARRCYSMNKDDSLYVNPFDHPLIWSGNSTIIDELKDQLNGIVPDCVIASVGGYFSF
jgi:L-serine/L-threonine ammonia-lyase